MIFKQFYLGCLAHASYLIGDKSSRAAAVVDPQRDVAQYLEFAKRHGLSIRHVILTHFHADFVSGHLELAERGARIHLGARAKAAYPFNPLKEGDAVEFGKVRLEALETPGHTPEGISVLVYDLAKSAEAPEAVLTGDTLFIGDVGRPDLMASRGVTAKYLAGQLYDSLRGKLLRLPDRTLVYPAHGAGSLCGRNMSQDTVSTIGAQKRENYALKPMPKGRFVRLVTADLPAAPSYFAYDAKVNRSLRSTLEQSMRKLKPLSLPRLLALQRSGAQVLDVREASDFAAAHISGAVNVGLGGKYATWAGTVLSRSKPIALIAEPGRETEAALRLGRIGFDRVEGFLAGGMAALKARPKLVATVRRVTAAELAAELASPRPPLVLDVRNAAERQARRIPGSLHIPLDRLAARLGEVPRGRPLVIHCAGGYRSMIAASLLARRGWKKLADLLGGISAWPERSPSPSARAAGRSRA